MHESDADPSTRGRNLAFGSVVAGGGFMLVHLAEENRQLLIDYRETAPAAAKVAPSAFLQVRRSRKKMTAKKMMKTVDI